jgi:hypothetical protein
MKTMRVGVLALTSLALLAQTGCATREQWAEWRSHSSHFASGQHATFSFWNQGEQAERVRATDPEKARGESWWGRELPVSAAKGGS